MAIVKDTLIGEGGVYTRFFRYVDQEGFITTYKPVTPTNVKSAFGLTPIIWFQNTQAGLSDFDKAYKKIDLGLLFRLWSTQIKDNKWEPEAVPAALLPVFFSLMALSLYVQIYPNKLSEPTVIETLKNAEENLVYTYRMSIQKLNRIAPESPMYDKTVKNIRAYVQTRNTRYRAYVKGLVDFVETVANPSKL